MNWNTWIRQTHRWLSIVFTVTVVANIVFMSMGQGQPPAWITYSPLLPLALLLSTGLYLFVLPYAARWRSARRTGWASERTHEATDTL
jgi:hypothetical protein